VKKIKLIADLHVHTVASGHAYSTVEEYAAAAKKKGIKVIAITDHGPAMPGGASPYHFSNQRMIPERLNGVKILKGGEINIIDSEGHLDLADEFLKTMDFVSIAMHPMCGYEGAGEEGNTKALLKAMKNRYVRVLAHPGNPMFPIDHEKVIPEAKERGILIELNNSSLTISRKGSLDRCFAIAKFVKKIGWKVTLGSDAHISTMVGDLDTVLKMAVDAGLKRDDIINTSMGLIDKYLLRI
jgi:putative hydrolase